MVVTDLLPFLKIGMISYTRMLTVWRVAVLTDFEMLQRRGATISFASATETKYYPVRVL